MNDTAKDTARPISISQAYFLLNSIRERPRNPRTEATKIYNTTLEYCERFMKFEDMSAYEDVRKYQEILGFNEEEIAILGSLIPQTVDEAKICVPSVSRFQDDVIESVIEKLQKIV
ncbi:DNA-directed RNA polymerase II subunit RPB4 [Enteropsectra breve]|nr:DNA-directed RNA polymerase II subunit RPB4 [Enteropsectra breve]